MQIEKVDVTEAIKALSDLAQRIETVSLGSERANGYDDWVLKDDEGSPVGLVACETADGPVGPCSLVHLSFLAPSLNINVEHLEAMENSPDDLGGIVLWVVADLLEGMIVRLKLGSYVRVKE